jgi:hypothetical protein
VGQHFVPQRYLRNFEIPERPGFVWMHDNATGEARQVAIGQAAQSKNFYGDDATQKMLNNEIERPANPVIAKLLRAEAITPEERWSLAYYVGSMMMRVPATRKKMFSEYPDKLAEYFNDIRAQASALNAAQPVPPERFAQFMRQLDDIERRFVVEPPGDVVEQMLSPLPFRNMVQAIDAMAWRILVSSGEQFFCTSENPVFFDATIGLATRESEVSFPLSTTHALHCSWQRASAPLLYVQVPQKKVREINRRTASIADRAFYFERAPWLLGLLAKSRHLLTGLPWSEPPQWMTLPDLTPDGTRQVGRRNANAPATAEAMTGARNIDGGAGPA